MKLETMQMDRRDAVKKFREYRDVLRTQRTKDDDMLMECYRALKNGKRLINIGDVIRAGGYHIGSNLPKLAVCHAAARRCRVSVSGFGLVEFRPDDAYNRRSKSKQSIKVRNVAPIDRQHRSAEDFVPSIPPRFRPTGDLSEYHILWEADWKRPTTDPVLLKEVRFPFFAVLAMWDLTPLESSVLGIPLNSEDGIS